ncbi:PP2C family protein-serine/threonine phosphatase, partial [bacterium]|nr:PP2C family protein-serine/threonine phosphatase [bacterium]
IQQESLEKELSTATKIQHSFLPKTLPELPGWEIATRYQAAKQVGGDFYDLISLKSGDLGIVIADVADKGVPAALVMALSRTLVRGMAREDASPALALARTNDVLMSETDNSRFVTLFYGVLNPESGRMTFARAGHNPPFWWRASTQQVESILPPGIALGIMQKISLVEESSTLKPNDVIVFYTDGVTEAMNSDNEEFTEQRLIDLIRSNHHLSADALAHQIQTEVESFVGGRTASDDFTLVVLKRLSN